jgi:lipopolysaccharide transport system permease protein
MLVWYGMAVPPTILIVPLGIAALTALGSACGLVLVPAGLLYQDAQRGLGVVTMLWFFATPVVYPPPSGGRAAALARLNPVSILLVPTREWLTTGRLGAPGGVGLVAALTLLLLLASWVFCRLAMPHLIARMAIR